MPENTFTPERAAKIDAGKAYADQVFAERERETQHWAQHVANNTCDRKRS